MGCVVRDPITPRPKSVLDVPPSQRVWVKTDEVVDKSGECTMSCGVMFRADDTEALQKYGNGTQRKEGQSCGGCGSWLSSTASLCVYCGRRF